MPNNTGTAHATTGGVISNCLPDNWLKAGNNRHAAATATKAAIKVTKTDSARNWMIRYLRGEPSTLRTPTSRARLADRAVERFMKLTQAISKINAAIADKMYTYCMLPLASSSDSTLDLRCISFSGTRFSLK